MSDGLKEAHKLTGFSNIVAGRGAPSRRGYFVGEQQALLSRSRSACIGFSSLSQSSFTPVAIEPSLHEDLTMLLSQYDVNAAAASVKVYAIKPQVAGANTCCGPTCCS